MDDDIKPDIRTHHQPYSDKPGQPVQGCWDNDGWFMDIIYEFGDVWRNPKECNRKTCTRSGTIIEEVCPKLEVPPGCIRIRGHNPLEYQDFPYCCDRVACPGDEEYHQVKNDWFLTFADRCDDRYCVRDIGEEWSEHKYGVCNRKRCGRNEYDEPEIFETTCPEVDIPKGCKLEAYPDLTKEFPDCCPKVVCPKGHPANGQEAVGLDTMDKTNKLSSVNDKDQTIIITPGIDTNESKGGDKRNKSQIKVDQVENANIDSTAVISKYRSTKDVNKRNAIAKMITEGANILFRKDEKHTNVKSYRSTESSSDSKKKSKKTLNKIERQKDTENIDQKRKKKNAKENSEDKNKLDGRTILTPSSRESKGENDKFEAKDRIIVKTRDTETLRRKRKTTKSPKTEEEGIKARRSKRKKRKRDKKINENEGEENVREVISKVIKMPKKYGSTCFVYQLLSHTRTII